MSKSLAALVLAIAVFATGITLLHVYLVPHCVNGCQCHDGTCCEGGCCHDCDCGKDCPKKKKSKSYWVPPQHLRVKADREDAWSKAPLLP